MQTRSKFCVLWSVGVLACLPGSRTQAQTIVSMSGQIQGISAPASVKRDGIQSNTVIMAFQERQTVLLADPLGVNITQPGNYTKNALYPQVKIAAGTTVNCECVK